MAARFPEGNQVQLRPQKGHDMTWSCDKHGEPIAFYCKKHGLFVCDRCAIKEHCQKPCELDDIEDVIFERKKKVDEKQPEIQELQKQMKALDLKIKTALAFSDTNLQTVNNNIQASYHNKIKPVKEKEDRMIRVINEEAEEEIRLVNEKREKRIKDCHIEREKERKIIRDEEEKLLSDAKKITEIVFKKIKDLTNKSQHVINTIKNIECTITRINQRDETLVNEAPQVLASIDENLSLNVHQDVSDCLHRIENAIQGVKFVEGKVGGEYYDRIDGNKWELVKSIHIPSRVNKPWVRGLVSEDEICVQDGDNNNTYVTNINTKHTEKVIDEGVLITSCVPMDSNVIVCGKRRDDCTGDRLNGCITLYDRQRKVFRDISIPRNGYTSVHVDVDRDGMIIASQSNQSNIYIINPADDKIVNAITMQGKKVRGVIQALSSGDIVVKTGYDKYTVISRSGEEKAVIYSDEWGWWSECRVDKLTDILYIVHLDRANNTCTIAVDQVSQDGIIQARIVEYVQSDRSRVLSPCFITPSGNLVGFDGNKLHLYKKTFVL
ncbi:tripartite motif-containing protein 5-like [Lytechinus variegatus]|uniref:tripartite motif-containing protein 5-like n=1 Tax=Lytechinus variegatus TaxID=7654 RepID=UPI001BB0DC97|nr:tripartite motif-containing protein 5-like [Lytechinus variegatus]